MAAGGWRLAREPSVSFYVPAFPSSSIHQKGQPHLATLSDSARQGLATHVRRSPESSKRHVAGLHASVQASIWRLPAGSPSDPSPPVRPPFTQGCTPARARPTGRRTCGPFLMPAHDLPTCPECLLTYYGRKSLSQWLWDAYQSVRLIADVGHWRCANDAVQQSCAALQPCDLRLRLQQSCAALQPCDLRLRLRQVRVE